MWVIPIYALVGVMFVVAGVLGLVRHGEGDWLGWFFLALGPAWFLSAYVQHRRRRGQIHALASGER